MAPTVACVLKSGGIYTPEYVNRLRAGVKAYLPTASFRCFSDVASVATDPLLCGWPGWWSKMELFRPDVRGDLLYFDLDTVIHGDLSDIASVFRLTALRDFYRPDGLGSGMMFIPMHARATIWAAWTAKPDRWMGEYRSGGDQAFLEQFWLYEALRWQDIVPGQVVSFKANSEAERSRSRVTCYHGKPKPHETGWTP